MMPWGLSLSNDVNRYINFHIGIFYLKHHMERGIDENLPREVINYSSHTGSCSPSCFNNRLNFLLFFTNTLHCHISSCIFTRMMMLSYGNDTPSWCQEVVPSRAIVHLNVCTLERLGKKDANCSENDFLVLEFFLCDF